MVKTKSKIWLYFEKHSIEGLCKKCGEKKNFKGGNTSNLKSHLRYKHPYLYSEYLKIDGNSTITSDETAECNIDDPASLNDQKSSSVNGPTLISNETNISNSVELKKNVSFKQSQLKVYNAPDKKTIEKYKHAIAVWICTDMMPYYSVEKKGLKYLLSVLCPNFVLPSRRYFSDHKIPQLYEDVKTCIKEKLKVTSYLALTTDCWTSGNGYPFIGLTAHTINNDWEIESFCLACASLDLKHNSINIKIANKQILNDWDIDESKISGITTDCGANILKAVDLLVFNHIPCFGHVLNNGVTNAFSLSPVICCTENSVKVRSVFHYRSKMKRKLLNEQIALNLPPLVAPSSTDTRWWSLLPCLNFVKTQKEALHRILTSPKHHKLLPTFNQLKLIERLLHILNPLKELGEAISTETHGSISGLWPVYQQLESNLSKNKGYSSILNTCNEKSIDLNSAPLFPNTEYITIYHEQRSLEETSMMFSQLNAGAEEDTEEGAIEDTPSQDLTRTLDHVDDLVCDTIFEKLNKRYYENSETKQLIQLASFLDPRYKLTFLNNNDWYLIKQKLEREMEKLQVHTVEKNEPSKKKKNILE